MGYNDLKESLAAELKQSEYDFSAASKIVSSALGFSVRKLRRWDVLIKQSWDDDVYKNRSAEQIQRTATDKVNVRVAVYRGLGEFLDHGEVMIATAGNTLELLAEASDTNYHLSVQFQSLLQFTQPIAQETMPIAQSLLGVVHEIFRQGSKKESDTFENGIWSGRHIVNFLYHASPIVEPFYRLVRENNIALKNSREDESLKRVEKIRTSMKKQRVR